MIPRDRIYEERVHQLTKWSVDHDDEHSHEDWIRFIREYIWKEPIARRIVQVAAIAVAAIESHDREVGFKYRAGGTVYDELDCSGHWLGVDFPADSTVSIRSTITLRAGEPGLQFRNNMMKVLAYCHYLLERMDGTQ